MEYPPIIGLGNWLISFITPDQFSDRWFFDINAAIAIILFLLSALLVKKMRPEYAYLYPLAPAVVASLFYKLGFMGGSWRNFSYLLF